MSPRLKYILIFICGVLVILAATFVISKKYVEPKAVDVTDAASTPTAENNMERVVVSRVVDGDTLKIKTGGTEDTVRLIGINTPESVDPRTTVECFGKEASTRMKEIAEGKEVLVVKDPTQGERDKYHRLLAYVYLTDGILLNQKMIEDGYAFEYTYNIPYEFQTEFKGAEKDAREKGLGLWDKSKCDYTSDPKKSSTKSSSK
ncbi:MAG: Micrococcal nuclease [Candidatus Taylorbacteria bacterium]|nr:Micrococcal nuclease [Candidatus Taylorbacteria bacterium]